MPAVSALFALAFVSTEAPIQIKSGEDLIRAMHAKYSATWYRKLTFVQRVIRPGRPEEEWWEAALIPGRLRIDVAPVDSGQSFVYRGDSSYIFSNGKLTQSAADRNILLILGFDVYGQPPAKTIELLKAEDYDLTRVREATWEGRPAYVVGTDNRQFWVDKDRLLFLRVLEPGPQGASIDIRFNKYVKLEGGWIAPEVVFLRNGTEFMREVYRDWKVNPAVNEDLFAVPPWKRAVWIPKQ